MREVHDTIEMNGFEFRITFEADDLWHDFSWLGEYSNSPKDGAIDRKLKGDQDRNEYRYFNPENSLEETREWYRKAGYSKHQAHEIAKHQILEDYELAEKYNDGSLYFELMTVAVYYKGHKLGSASVGEIDDRDAGIHDYKYDLMHESICEAIAYLIDLDSKPKTLAKTEAAKGQIGDLMRANTYDKVQAMKDKLARNRSLAHEYQNNTHRTRHFMRRLRAARGWK